MYLKVLDDLGVELVIDCLSLLDVNWKMLPPITDTSAYTIINGDRITFNRARKGGWAAQIAVHQEVDGGAIAIIPLDHGWHVGIGDKLQFAPGELKISVDQIRPGGRLTPEPKSKIGPIQELLSDLFGRFYQNLKEEEEP